MSDSDTSSDEDALYASTLTEAELIDKLFFIADADKDHGVSDWLQRNTCDRPLFWQLEGTDLAFYDRFDMPPSERAWVSECVVDRVCWQSRARILLF